MKIEKLQKVLCALLVGGTVTVGCIAEAAIDTGKLPLQTYVAKRVYCGNSPGATSNSYWIDANRDLVTIKQYSGEWAYGTYPNSKGQAVTRWFRMSDVLGNINFSNYETNMKQKQIVYRTESSGQTIGTVFNDENVVVVYEGGNRTQIIYRLSNNKGYKMGWVPNSSINRRSASTSREQVTTTTIPQNPLINTNISRPAENTNTNTTVTPNTNTASYQQWQGVANKRGTAYTNSSLTTKNLNEWVDRGDNVTVLAEEGNAYYVEYEGKYRGKPTMKQRWVKKSVIDRTGNNVIDDTNYVSNDTEYIWPVDCYRISCLFFYSSGSKHGATLKGYSGFQYNNAIDVAASMGQDVKSVKSGTVEKAYNAGNNSYGNLVVINHGNNIYSLYAHMSKISCRVGDYVNQGDKIGEVGDTGNGGTHLHFAITIDNPWKYYRDKYNFIFEDNCWYNNVKKKNDAYAKEFINWWGTDVNSRPNYDA